MGVKVVGAPVYVDRETGEAGESRQVAPPGRRGRNMNIRPSDTAGESFRDQFAAEMADLGLRPPGEKAFSQSEADHERWVIDNPNDVVGLALSGGGIRSGIFNLGLLQGLADLDVLRHFHYLSTVSGGGSKSVDYGSGAASPETALRSTPGGSTLHRGDVRPHGRRLAEGTGPSV